MQRLELEDCLLEDFNFDYLCNQGCLPELRALALAGVEGLTDAGLSALTALTQLTQLAVDASSGASASASGKRVGHSSAQQHDAAAQAAARQRVGGEGAGAGPAVSTLNSFSAISRLPNLKSLEWRSAEQLGPQDMAALQPLLCALGGVRQLSLGMNCSAVAGGGEDWLASLQERLPLCHIEAGAGALRCDDVWGDLGTAPTAGGGQ